MRRTKTARRLQLGKGGTRQSSVTTYEQSGWCTMEQAAAHLCYGRRILFRLDGGWWGESPGRSHHAAASRGASLQLPLLS